LTAHVIASKAKQSLQDRYATKMPNHLLLAAAGTAAARGV